MGEGHYGIEYGELKDACFRLHRGMLSSWCLPLTEGSTVSVRGWMDKDNSTPCKTL